MKACFKDLLLLYVWMCGIFCNQMRSLGCCGSGPDKQECSCRGIDSTETLLYYSLFTNCVSTDRQPQITAHPDSATFVKGVKVTLHCTITHPSMAVVEWLHNGTAVSTSSRVQNDYAIEDCKYQSTLTITQFSESSQGEYSCKVGDGKSTIVSATAILQLPKFLGWIDRAYPTPSDADSVTVIVQKSGSVILECSPNTTESIRGKMPVILSDDNKTSTINLPSGNALMMSVEENTIITCVWPLGQAQSRQFNIIVSQDLTPQDLKLVVRPSDRVVAAGSTVELYCIAEGHMTATTIDWFIDGSKVNNSDGGYVIVGDGQVLEIIESTVTTSGIYTCLASVGLQSVNASAKVTVVDPPGKVSLTVSGDISTTFRVEADTIILPPTTNNISLTILCNVETSTDEYTYYQWLQGGVVIDAGPGRNVLLTADLSNVLGSYQCIVSNIAGKTVSKALWIILEKPNSPSNVVIYKNNATGIHYQYDITWEQPEHSQNYHIINYTVQTLAIRDNTYAYFCSCVGLHSSETNAFYSFNTGCLGLLGNSPLYQLHYKVAANTAQGTQSDFVPGENTSITPDVPPKATGVYYIPIEIVKDKWELILNWRNDFEKYGKSCVVTELQATSPCNTAPKRIASGVMSYKVSMDCCTTCDWSVINSNHVDPMKKSVNTITVKTKAISPLAPPKLNSVQHLGTNGKDFIISFELPENSKSCMCEITNGLFGVTLLTNDSLISPVTSTIPLSASTFNVTLPGVHCSDSYTISMAYSNTEGQSNFSTSLPIGLPSGRNVPTFSGNKLSCTNNVTHVSVHYDLEQGAQCLLNEGYLQANICYSEITQASSCSHFLLNKVLNCSNINHENGFISLPRYQNFCIVAEISSQVLDFNTSSVILFIPANEGIPTSRPNNLKVEVVDNILNFSWQAPPLESWNGIPFTYSLNISVDEKLIKSIDIDVPSILDDIVAYVYSDTPYDSTKDYNISVASCTRVGCGPAAHELLHEATTTPSTTTTDPGTNIVVLSSTISAAAITVLSVFVIILVTILCCCHRRKKGYGVLRNESEARVPIILCNDEPLQRDREPPMGAMARSEYTDLESLYSSNSGSRVAEWVKHTTHRDGYVKDAEEELEQLQQAQTQENDNTESTVPVVQANVHISLSAESEAQTKSEANQLSVSPVQQLSVPQSSSNGYFSEADILLQNSTSSSTAKSTVVSPITSVQQLSVPQSSSNGYFSESGLLALQRSTSSSTVKSTVLDSVTASSSGYNTEQSFTPFQTKTVSLIQREQDTHEPPVQTAYYGAHNPTTNNVCHKTPTSTKHTSTIDYQVTDTDFISSLLFQEDFNPLKSSSHVNIQQQQQTIMTSTPSNAPPTQPPEALHTSPRKTPYVQHTSSPVHSTTKYSRCSQLTDSSEEGETDSVFDNSIIPLTQTAKNVSQGRTRSSMTSGFCSLSNTSLDSNDNVEMTQLLSHHSTTPSPPNRTHPPPTSWKPPTSKIAPVIPSLLNTHQSHTPPLLAEIPTLPNYENIDDTLLKSDEFQFEL